MLFIIGGYASGKHEFARRTMKCAESDIFTITDVIVSDYEKNSEAIFDIIKRHKIVIASEIGCGILPLDKHVRTHREAAGRLSIRLAETADVVVQMVCGIPRVIKGQL